MASGSEAATGLGSGDGDLRLVSELPIPAAVRGGVAQPVATGDMLDVSVFQVPDLSRTVQVDDHGYVTLPLIGQIRAAGKSVQSLQGDIGRAYGARYLQSPNVSVLLKESASRRVTVDGEVRRSGVFPLPATSSLLDVVALAGGFSDVADPSKVYVFRKVDNISYASNYSVSDIRSGNRRNPPIYGGDVVIVFSSDARVAWRNLKDALGVASTAARFAPL